MEQLIADYGYLALVVGLILENTLIAGIIFPGTTLVLLAGFSAGLGALNIGFVIVLAFVAVVFADTLSFLIARKMAPRFPVVQRYIQQQVEHVNNRTEFRFSALFFQFVSTIRFAVPLAAGTTNVSFKKWLLFDAIAASIFVAALPGVGYLGGRVLGSQAQTETIASYIQYGIVTVVLVSIMTGTIRYRKKRN